MTFEKKYKAGKKIVVRAHPRKGTKGVKQHTRTLKRKRTVPYNDSYPLEHETEEIYKRFKESFSSPQWSVTKDEPDVHAERSGGNFWRIVDVINKGDYFLVTIREYEYVNNKYVRRFQKSKRAKRPQTILKFVNDLAFLADYNDLK